MIHLLEVTMGLHSIKFYMKVLHCSNQHVHMHKLSMSNNHDVTQNSIRESGCNKVLIFQQYHITQLQKRQLKTSVLRRSSRISLLIRFQSFVRELIYKLHVCGFQNSFFYSIFGKDYN